MTALDAIRCQSYACKSPLLDAKIFSNCELYKVVEYLCCPDSAPVERNVPVAAIFGLTHINMLPSETIEPTWRLALGGLKGEGWTDAIFCYFLGRIAETEFPAPGSRGYLDLNSYGGLVCCTNGVHRTVAAYNWLIATQGEHAVLNDAMVCTKRVRRRVVESLLKESNFCSIQIHSMGAQCMPARQYVKETTNIDIECILILTRKAKFSLRSKKKYIVVSGDTLKNVSVKPRRRRHGSNLVAFEELVSGASTEILPKLLERMLDDKWLQPPSTRTAEDRKTKSGCIEDSDLGCMFNTRK